MLESQRHPKQRNKTSQGCRARSVRTKNEEEIFLEKCYAMWEEFKVREKLMSPERSDNAGAAKEEWQQTL